MWSCTASNCSWVTPGILIRMPTATAGSSLRVVRQGDFTPFGDSLGVERHGRIDGDEHSFAETIKDRVSDAIVGQVAPGQPPTTLGGAAAANGRYVISTATPLGRDAIAIEGCWDRFFPLAPDA